MSDVLLLVLLVVTVAMEIVLHVWEKRRPKQNEQVRVTNIRARESDLFATFEFSDGSKKEFKIDVDTFLLAQVNGTGIITYNEWKNAKDHNRRNFYGFVKDPKDLKVDS